ncbi:MAG: hypothetical protein R6W96_02390, partial [Clostridia bacterium]
AGGPFYVGFGTDGVLNNPAGNIRNNANGDLLACKADPGAGNKNYALYVWKQADFLNDNSY